MKLTEHSNSLKTNAKQVKSQEFGIGDASVVIEILRNRLYRHPIRTLTQEYISNARDANREIKAKKPIEVTLPTQLSPTFKVRDFGPGVDPDRMQNVFVLYGASTKRSTNDQTGGFGIGAKSAWSYTDSFTIVTFVNGTRRVYVAHTGVNNNGRLDLIETNKTNEPNGTEIQIAVNPEDLRDFQDAIFRATYFWQDSEKPIYKGIVPEDVPERVKGIAIENLEIMENQLLPSCFNKWGRNNHYLLIDGIPYEIENQFFDKIDALHDLNNLVRGALFINLPNGAVEISASRESIADSTVTTDALINESNYLRNKVVEYIKTQFKGIKDVFEYISKYKEMHSSFDVDQFGRFKDYNLEQYRFTSPLFDLVNIYKVTMDSRGLKKTNLAKGGRSWTKKPEITYEYLEKLYFNDEKESVVKLNRRLRHNLQSSHRGILFFELRPGAVDTDLQYTPRQAFDKLKKDLQLKNLNTLPEPPKEVIQKQRASRPRGKFCVHSWGNYGRQTHTLDASSIDTETQWLYVVMDGGSYPNNWSGEKLKDLNRWIENNTKYRIGCIAKGNLKHIKGLKNFKPLDDYLAKMKANSEILGFIKRQKYTERAQEYSQSIEEVNGIKDPLIVEMLREHKSFKKGFSELPTVLFNKFEKHADVKAFEKLNSKFEKRVEKHYAIVPQLYEYRAKKVKEDLAFYINAKYESEVKS